MNAEPLNDGVAPHVPGTKHREPTSHGGRDADQAQRLSIKEQDEAGSPLAEIEARSTSGQIHGPRP